MHIYMKIDQDSCGAVDVYEYAAFVRTALHAQYPAAEILIETTERESGVMPMHVQADTWEEEVQITEAIRSLWDRFCKTQ